jgi:photosystem II stability/assembly factor-like uncharacterized protein
MADTSAAASISQGLQWRLVGPHRGGRTRAITGVPGQPHAFLAGAVNGGVWRSDDDGRTWAPIFDSQPTQSIGAIAVAASDPSIIYVGSGEGLHRPDLSVGNGMYRSTDGGRSWTHLGLEDAQQIPDVAVDPRDPNRVYAAVLGHPFGPSAQRGIYRSLDGGATWQQVLGRDQDTGGSFVRIDPFDAKTLYAGLWNVRSGPWEDKNTYNGTKGGLFKSTDGGEHWRALKEGLPTDLSQIDVAVAPSTRGRLYATVATSAEGEYGSAAGLGVYRSDDGGEHWRVATTDPRPAMRIGGGDLSIIKVDPTNADVLFSVSIVMHKSEDGGTTWTPFKGAPGGDDYQNLWISPQGSQQIALVSDQGTVITVNGGRTWSSWYNQPTAQLYHIGITPTYPYRLCSGQQESGSVCISSRGNDGEITYRDWHPVGVIEYGYVLPDPVDADIIYGAGRNVVTRTHLSTGQVQNITPLPLLGADDRVTRTEPILFAPQDPHRMYVAANRLYATSDGGNSWTAISGDLARPSSGSPPSVGDQVMPKAGEQRGAIYAVSASPVAKGLLWAGTDDGFVWVTHDEGGHWENVTPPALTPWSKVTQIEASRFDSQAAYVSVSRFRIDDLKPYIYRTRDGGKSWQMLTAGMPADAPVNAVREDPERRGLLFAATEKAVWMSADDAEHWVSLQLNLPHTSMRDLAIHGQDLIVATHGRAFWVLDDIGPLRSLAGSAHNDPVLLAPAAAIRARRSTGSDTPIPPDEPTARNPPSGAIIDYYLPRAEKELSIEVLDASGKLVRRVRSTDTPGPSAEERAKEMIPAYWIRQPSPLGTDAGAHRFVWDLHYATPLAVHRGYPISAVPHDTPQEPEGPLAAPGNYVVRLSIGKRHWDQALRVLPDPRVSATAAEFAAQYALAQQLADALDASSDKVLQAKSMRVQLKAMNAPGDAAGAAKALDQRLQELLEPAAQANGTPPRGLQRVNNDIAQLYDQVNGADAAPTQSQSAAATRVLAECKALLASSAGIWSQDLPALNDALKKAHVPTVRSEAVPEAGGQNVDEE